MKKFMFIALFALICISCREREAVQTAPQTPQVSAPVVAPAGMDMSQVYTYNPQEVIITPQEDDFYRSNIVVKGSGDDYVIYEYSDVRIDKVATLASRYCYDICPQLSAYLRDLYMNKNHKRRATFECIDLASH